MIENEPLFLIKNNRDSSFVIIVEVAHVRLWGGRDTGPKGCALASIRRKSGAVTPGNKRVSLRGVTSWHIRLYFSHVARY